MTYKTILVCLTTTENAERLCRAACQIARKFDAHLIGIHTLQALLVHPGVGVHLPANVARQFHDHQKKETQKIREVFERATASEDFVSEWREVRANSVHAGDRLVEHARCADLVVMSQADAQHDRMDQSQIHREVIAGAGRPVLVVPNIDNRSETIGQHALIGWSATREATRAAHDAIPFFADGGTARILWVSSDEREADYLDVTAHELAITLDRHGAKAIVERYPNAEIPIGDVLLNEAFERGADMIVTGAYGHSRVYDFVIGATTTHLLRHMTVPVLFSN